MIVPAQFRVIAHRGASAYAPENTLPAFTLARKMNCREVELDLQLSSEGEVMVCHDRTLERYGHGSELVEEQTSDYLRNLDMGSWFSPFMFEGTPMLTLKELFKEFGDSFVYHLELKGRAAGLAAATAEIVREHSLLDNCVFTSFSFEQLERMKTVIAKARLGWLVQELKEVSMEQARKLELFQICPIAMSVTQYTVESMRAVAPEVRAWGLHGEAHEVRGLIQKIVAAGCDGMTLNWPDWVTQQS